MQLSEQNACGIHVDPITLFFQTWFSVLDTLASAQITSHYTKPPPMVDILFSKWMEEPEENVAVSLSFFGVWLNI